jgi:hypothetical protein
MSLADISIMDQCPCGSGPRKPNFECERCRLVWFVQLVGQMRSAQTTYFSDRNSLNLDRARHLESQVDVLVKRFTSRPESTLFPDDQSGDVYYGLGG